MDLSHISTSDLERLQTALVGARLAYPLSRFGLQGEGLDAVAAVVGELNAIGRDGALGVIGAVLAERQGRSTPPELVWTGPEARSSGARDTAVVLADLFSRATSSVLLPRRGRRRLPLLRHHRMTPARRKALAARLERLIAELVQKRARSIDPARGDELDVKVDEDQQPLTEMSQAIASNLNRADAATLARARKALTRLKTDPDDFGNCQDCGDEIPAARLDAMPFVELCVDCQAKTDARRPTRSKLTDFS